MKHKCIMLIVFAKNETCVFDYISVKISVWNGVFGMDSGEVDCSAGGAERVKWRSISVPCLCVRYGAGIRT